MQSEKGTRTSSLSSSMNQNDTYVVNSISGKKTKRQTRIQQTKRTIMTIKILKLFIDKNNKYGLDQVATNTKPIK